MPEPTGQDLHIDTFLSNLSIAYMNEADAYIADKVFPAVPVDKQSDKYARYKLEDWFRDEAKQRAPLTESAGAGFALDTPGTFFCNEYAWHMDYADDDVDNADAVFNLDDDATQYCIEKLKLSRERRWASQFFGESIWGTDLQGQSASPGANEFLCWDVASSTPIDDIDDAKSIVQLATGLLPNTLVVSYRVHQFLKNHASITDRYKYTQAAIITEDLLAKVFEVDRYLVAKAIYASGTEGNETLAYALNQAGALLIYSAPVPSKRRPSGGYTFRWKRPRWGGNTGERLESTVRKFYMQKLRGTRVECGVYEDIKLVANACGVYFNNAIALGSTIT